MAMGIFEHHNGRSSPNELAVAINDAASRCYGVVGVEWLRRIVADRSKLADRIKDGIARFVKEVVPSDAAGQVQRVARRFALVAVAGELATRYGLTGWKEEDASKAVSTCFAAWFEAFGGAGDREDRAILAQVKAFFEAHGASRFEDMVADKDQRINNRAGFYRTRTTGEREYMVLPEAFRYELCKGFDFNTATRVMVQAGWLEPGKDGKSSQKQRLPGLSSTRCYVFTARMWEGE